jgi:hypothetical protein
MVVTILQSPFPCVPPGIAKKCSHFLHMRGEMGPLAAQKLCGLADFRVVKSAHSTSHFRFLVIFPSQIGVSGTV